MAFDLKSASYCGAFRVPAFVLHVDDPPSLLPTDISKYAWSARRRYPPFATIPGKGWARSCWAEAVHRLLSRGMKKASAVVVTSKASASEVEQLYGIQPEIVRLGIRLPKRLAGPEMRLPSPVVFLSVGRLERNKRVDWILKALKILESSQPPLSARVDWRLHIVGEGSQKIPLMELCTALGFGCRVTFHGFVSEQQLEAIYKMAHIFLMPAVQGYGIPALEALARRVAVVLSRESRVSEVFEQSSAVRIVENGEGELAQGILGMVEHLQEGGLRGNSWPTIRADNDWVQEIAGICDW